MSRHCVPHFADEYMSCLVLEELINWCEVQRNSNLLGQE